MTPGSPGPTLASEEEMGRAFLQRERSCNEDTGRKVAGGGQDVQTPHLPSQPPEASDFCSWRSQLVIPTLSLGSSAHLVKWRLSFPVCKMGEIVATSLGWCQN